MAIFHKHRYPHFRNTIGRWVWWICEEHGVFPSFVTIYGWLPSAYSLFLHYQLWEYFHAFDSLVLVSCRLRGEFRSLFSWGWERLRICAPNQGCELLTSNELINRFANFKSPISRLISLQPAWRDPLLSVWIGNNDVVHKIQTDKRHKYPRKRCVYGVLRQYMTGIHIVFPWIKSTRRSMTCCHHQRRPHYVSHHIRNWKHSFSWTRFCLMWAYGFMAIPIG